MPLWLPPCPIKLLTGLDCPGCGGTRMMWCLVHGDLAGAWHHNALALVALPIIALLIVGRLRGVRLLPRWRPMPIVLLGVGAVWTVLRNLPFPPFDALHV